MSDWRKSLNPQPGVIGPAPALCLFQIVQFYSSAPLPGYPMFAAASSSFAYDADAQMPNGLIVQFRKEISQTVAPRAQDRWDDSRVCEAFQPGQWIPGVITGSTVYLLVAEDRWAAPCDWRPGTDIPPTTPPIGVPSLDPSGGKPPFPEPGGDPTRGVAPNGPPPTLPGGPL